jgi:hypothetical protein
MKLLGSYSSKLTEYHREELIKLLQAAIAAGEYGGGKLIDGKVGGLLRQQAADFASLPAVSAGSRADAESLLYPLRLLAARYETISKERQDFLARMRLFLDVLEKDSNLIDQLVAAANMETWVARRGPLSGAVQFYQDFSASHGAVSVNLPLTDPATGVPYDRPVQDVGFLLNSIPGKEAEPLRFGIGTPAEVRHVPAIRLSWSYPEGSVESEELSGADWSKLSLLESRPVLRYGAPSVSVLIPEGTSAAETFEITGSEEAGNVPVFVRTSFRPRQSKVQIQTAAAGEGIPVTNYKLLGDDFQVVDSERSYERGIDYTVDAIGRLVPAAAAANKTLTVLFTEMFPAYECSVNQEDWSSPVMFDPARPGLGITVANGRFPVLDETDRPTGLFLRLLKTPATDYLIRIDTKVTSDYGVAAVLEVELDRPVYLNGLHLAPFVTFPARLRSIRAEGLTENTGRSLFEGDVVVDRALSVRFPRQLVRRFFLRFYQENYAFKEHVVDPEDKLRRETLVGLQASLPLSSRRVGITPARRVEGAQYEFGVRDVWGEDFVAQAPGVFIAGPFEVSGTPELIRLDAEYSGDVDFYLLDSPYNQSEVLIGSAFHATNPHGIEITPGRALAFTPPPEVPALAKCQFHVKFVLRDEHSVVERYLLQVNHV